MKIIIALLLFSAIILIHELGHFLLAKASHVVVTEFSLGMGPRLFSVKKGETRYSVKLLPLGGSCIMLGEDADDESPGSFLSAPVPARIAIVAAGPAFNFLFSLILGVILVGAMGTDPARITSVSKDSSAWEAGLQEGDLITEYQGYHVDLAKDLYVYTYLNPLTKDEQINLTVKRDGEKIKLSFLPDTYTKYLLGFNRADVNSLKVDSLIKGYPLEDAGVKPGDVITSINGVPVPDGQAYEDYLKDHPLSGEEVVITYERDGLSYEASIVPAVYEYQTSGFSYNLAYQKVSGPAVLKYGFLELKYMIRSTLLSLKELFTGGIGVKELSGPVGLVDTIGDTYEESRKEGVWMVLMNLINMALLISANLGVMNLLPIPALDGGRLVFLIIELVRGKNINREVEGSIHFVGLMLLMAFMIFIMYNDILKIIP